MKIYWRATFNKTSVELSRDDVSLVNELQAVSGYTICTAGQTECLITVEIKDDKVSAEKPLKANFVGAQCSAPSMCSWNVLNNRNC